MPASRRPLVVARCRPGILVGLLAGCVSREDGSGAQQAPATVPLSELSGLTLQVGDQKGGTESLLRAAGALDNLPYKVAFSTFTSGPPQIEAATAGKIDFAITGNTPPIFGAASNAKVKVVSAYDGGGCGDRSWCTPIRRSASIADLRGKRIAVGKGSSAHGHMLAQLNRAGLCAVRRHAGVPAARRRAVGVHPAPGRRVGGLGPVHRTGRSRHCRCAASPRRTGVTNGAGFGVASDEALADPKRNTALSDLLVRYAKAVRWAKDNPDEWAQSYAAAVGLDPKVAAVGAGVAACGCRPRCPTSWWHPSRRWPTSSPNPSRSRTAPKFADWVDRRYSDALAPLYINRNEEPTIASRPNSSGSCPPTVTAARSSAPRTPRRTTFVPAELPRAQPPVPRRGGPRGRPARLRRRAHPDRNLVRGRLADGGGAAVGDRAAEVPRRVPARAWCRRRWPPSRPRRCSGSRRAGCC